MIVVLVALYVTACCAVAAVWLTRSPVDALAGLGTLSMSSGFDGGDGGGPTGSGPSVEQVRARIVSPVMQERVRRWLRALLVPSQDREDLAQDVTSAAIRSAGTYDPSKATVERWLNGVTCHLAGEWHARAQRRREELVDLVPEQQDGAEPADLALCAEADRQELLAALQEVPKRLRDVLVAYELAGLSMVEVAASAGVPATTAYKWRARGLAALAEVLRKRR